MKAEVCEIVVIQKKRINSGPRREAKFPIQLRRARRRDGRRVALLALKGRNGQVDNRSASVRPRAALS